MILRNAHAQPASYDKIQGWSEINEFLCVLNGMRSFDFAVKCRSELVCEFSVCDKK